MRRKQKEIPPPVCFRRRTCRCITPKCYVSALPLTIYGGHLRFQEMSGGALRFFQGWKLSAGIKPLDTKAPRKPRADAARNRERVLEAAKTVFSAGGPEASLEAVARTAGVGIGTLYRHFPTREALFEAVYRREVQQLADLGDCSSPMH